VRSAARETRAVMMDKSKAVAVDLMKKWLVAKELGD
jgi:hypothetical protein